MKKTTRATIKVHNFDIFFGLKLLKNLKDKTIFDSYLKAQIV